MDLIDKYLGESSGNPKKGDKFVDKKGKKITIVSVGSGIRSDAGDNIEIKYDGEKFTRDVKMTKFFRDFKYVNEAYRSRSYSGDPKVIKAKFATKCAETGMPIIKGEECVYYPKGKKCYKMNSKQARDFRDWKADIAMGYDY